MEYNKIGIVTVLYNSETVLSDFFSSLNNQTFRNFILYVIDNKSPDNSLAIVKQISKEVFFETKIIENDVNYGIAKGNNQGIDMALKDNCDYILLSNNDVILNPSTIEILFDRMRIKEKLVAVPKIYTPKDNYLWFAGGKYNYLIGSGIHIGLGEFDKGQYNKEKLITYSPTCFMLIHKSVFVQIGFMDEAFFVYWDDTDFCYRMIKNKIDILYTYKSTLVHKESVCTGKRSDFFYRFVFRNRIYFARKHFKISIYYILINFVNLYIFRRIKMHKNIRQWSIIKDAIFEGLKMPLSKSN